MSKSNKNSGSPEQSSSKRTKIVTLFAGGLAIAYVFLVFLPMQKELRQSMKAVRDKHRFLSDAGSLAERQRQLNQEITAVKEVIDAWRKGAPKSESVSAVFGDVIQRAKQSGAQIVNFTPRPETPLETVSMVPVSLSLEGSFTEIQKFLASLESMPCTVWVEGLEMKGKEKDETKLGCELKLIIFADYGEKSV